jgi:phosphoglycolate phosphatase-like HAD superfamily hydrolase
MNEDLLPSWNDGAAKAAILQFVQRATTPGPDFVPVPERVAAFDNDGTLWVEVPMPPQFDFVFRRWQQEVAADPALADVQPYKALIDRDPAFLQGVAAQHPDVVETILEAFARSWAGSTPAEFDAEVREWLATVRQPTLGALYKDLVYLPMLELFDLLKDNGFRVFVCSGGGRDFMRVFAEETWGIHKENVIGSAAEYVYSDGALVRGTGLVGSINLGPRKPESIFAQAGRLPVLAGGNADGDIEMLTVASFSLLIHHDDPDREFAYVDSAEESVAIARERGWTIVSMKRDWKVVFGEPVTRA